MIKALKTALLALLLVAGEAYAQFCPGLPPWVFDDVPSTHPFCTNITWMAQRGVTLGCSVIDANHRLYCPNANVTRSEMAAFLYRLGFQNSLLQGGNAFGAIGVFGTVDSQPLELIAGASRVMRYEPSAISPNVIGGSPANSVTPGVRGATIAGGGVPTGDTDPAFGLENPNRITDSYGTVGGGFANQAGDDAGSTTDSPGATVGGGFKNAARGHSSTVAGGTSNTASGDASVVAGGGPNSASGFASAVGGGYSNVASGDSAIVSGGDRNWASGDNSTVMGGSLNIASGDYSFAAGLRARAFANGSFVLADSTDFDFGENIVNRFQVRATGGVRFTTAINGAGATIWSCLAVAGTGWACSSDRNQKQNLRKLDGQAVLERLVAMPVFAWNPKGINTHVNHYGPTAQDFHATFGLGDDDTLIGSQDADGVALAAIQGLNAKLEVQLSTRDAIIGAQAREISELRRSVDQLLARMAPEGSLARTE